MVDRKVTISAILDDEISPVANAILSVLEDIRDSFDDVDDETKKSVRSQKTFTTALKTTGRAVRGAIGLFERMARSLVNIKTLFAGVLAGVAFREIIQAAAETDSAIREIGTIIPDVSSETLAQLNDDIRDAAVQGGQEFQDEFKAAYDAISAGVEAQQLLRFLRTANKLAVGGVSDVSTSVDLLTTVLNSYQKATEEAEDVSDTLFTTVRLGKTTIDEIAGPLGRLTPLASATGVSFEELGAAIAVLTSRGLSTDIAVTSLISLLSTLLQQQEAALEVSRELGIEFSVAAIQTQGFANFLTELSTAADGNIDTLRGLFSNTRALNAILSLGANNASQFNEALEQFADRSGATQKAFELLNSGLQSSLNRIRLSISSLVIELSESFTPEFQSILDQITSITEGITSAVRGFREGGLDSGALASIGRSFLSVLSTGAADVGKLIGRAILNVITVGLVALQPVLQDLFTSVIRPAFNETLGQLPGIEEIGPSGIDRIVEARQQLVEVNQELTTAERRLELAAGAVQRAIADGLTLEDSRLRDLVRIEGLTQGRVNSLQETQSQLNSILEDYNRGLTDRTSEATRAIQEAFEGVSQDFSEDFGTAVDNLKSGLEDLGETVQSAVPEPAEEAVPLFTQILERVSSMVGEAQEFKQNLVQSNLEAQKSVTGFTTIETVLKSAVDLLRRGTRLSESFGTNVFSGAQGLTPQLELAAREAEISGNTDEAARLRLQISQINELSEAREAYGDSLDEILPKLLRVQELERQSLSVQQLSSQSLEEVARAQQAYEDALESLQQRQQAGFTITANDRQNIEELREAYRLVLAQVESNLESLAGGNSEVAASAREALASVRGLQEGLSEAEVASPLDGAIQGFKDLRSQGMLTAQVVREAVVTIGNTIVNNLSQSLTDAITGAKSLKDAFADFARQTLTALIQLTIRLLLFRALAGALGIPLVPAGNTGGLFTGENFIRANSGRLVPGGGPDRDSVLGYLTPGEYVNRRKAVEYYGVRFFEMLNQLRLPKSIGYSGRAGAPSNRPAYNQGGTVGTSSVASGPSRSFVVMDSKEEDRLFSGSGDALKRHLANLGVQFRD